MRKLFTLTLALLASFSLWAAEETFTFAWTSAGTAGYAYSQAGPTSGTLLSNNAVYFVSNEGPKVDASKLNPYRVGFIFKPTVNVTLKLKGSAGSSARTIQSIKIDKDIDARFYSLCKDAVGSSKTVMKYALDNASDEDKAFYATVGILKVSKGVYSVAGDAKSASGQTAQADLYDERLGANNIAITANNENEETLTTGSPAEEFTFEAGKYYRVYTETSSSTGTQVVSFTFVSTATEAPTISAPTTDQTATYTVGEAIAALSITATGNPLPTYQWYYNSSASTTGATSLGSSAQTASYTPANNVASDLYYYCVATNSASSATSPFFHVTVLADPEASIHADTAIYVNDAIDLEFSTLNTSSKVWNVTLNAAAATENTDYSLVDGVFTPKKAGEFVITVTQVADASYGSVNESVTITANAKTPVSSVTIDGPTAGIIGQELTYTATATNATNYQWLVDGIDANTNAPEFTYTAVKGSHSIVCKARNQFNVVNEEEVWIASAPIALTVTKLCGMLIKATHKKAKTADIDPASVVGGEVDKNTQDGGKLGSNDHYFGIKLASGNFMPEDTVIITASTSSAVVEIFSTKTFSNRDDSLNYLDHGTFDANKVYKYVLTTSTQWIYLYRTKTAGSSMNPVLGSIEVHRPCEESSNTNIAKLTVNGEEVTPSGSAYTYTLSSSYEEATVTVAVTPEHPLATITDNIGGALANPFTVTTPATGESSIMPFRVVAEDGSYYNYVVTINKSASLSDDAALSALTVDGYTLTPTFDPESLSYTITKAYSADPLEVGDITATPHDANAEAVVTLSANVFTITVTAEDGKTTKEYTITVNTADARKDLLRATFSNGAIGYISGSNIQVPYLDGEDEPTFVSTTFWNAEGTPSAEIVDGKLVVTGIDSKQATYTIEYVALTPMEASYEEITFSAVPSYIFSVYGWESGKGVKFSKDVEEVSNHRISEGKDRIYIALPAAKEVILTGGSGGARPIQVKVNGEVFSAVTTTPASGGKDTITLSSSTANFISIESNGNNGDAGFTKMQLVKATGTSLDNTADVTKAVKFFENGQLFIRRGEKVYTITGEEVK